MIWMLLFILLFVTAGLSLIYLATRFYKLGLLDKLSKGNKKYRVAISVLMVIVLFAAIWLMIGLLNAIVCMLHLMVFWLLANFVFWIAKKLRGQPTKRYYAGLLAIALTAGYLSMGWELAHHVRQTDYAIETGKAVGELRIVQFADSHVGTTFDSKGFAEHMKDIEALEPDVVLVTGDFVDDKTSKADMTAACQALGKTRTTYGVYVSLGNHDKGYYDADYRGYSSDDLVKELEKNKVIVLRDESVSLDDRFYIIGRKDRSEGLDGGKARAAMSQLVEPLDPQKFMIVMDHQPCDYKAQEKAGVDLVLSGHTHGGQMIPINVMGQLVSENDQTYGHEKRGHTDFIVTSGIADWSLGFKTGCKSEYVVVDVKEK